MKAHTKRRRSRPPAAAQAPAPVAVESWWNRWWPCVLITALVICAYLPSLSNGFVAFDDPDYVYGNSMIKGGLTAPSIAWAFDPHTLVGSNWHPLTLLSHMLDCQWYGVAPFGHHLTSLLFHAANSVLLFVVLRRMTGALYCSLAVAIWFGVHPAHVESVAWISERKDMLSGFFWMLTLLAYHEFVRRRANESSSALLHYFLALAAFALGLLAKPMLVTLPFVLLLLDYWPLQRVSLVNLRSLLLEKIPFFVLAAAFSVITFMAQKQAGAMNLVVEIPFLHRIPNAVVSYLRYVGMLLWPTDLMVFYPFRESWPASLVLVACLLVAGVLIASFWLGKRWRFWPVGWCWFFGTLVPVIGLVQVGGQSIADRYTYLPSIGLFIVIAWTVAEVFPLLRLPAWPLATVGALTAVVSVAATRHQIGFWTDGETLFRRVVTKCGDHYVPHLCLGAALVEKKRYREAIAELERSRELNPNVALTHINLTAALMADSRPEEALKSSREAVRLEPKYAAAWSNLASCQMQARDMPGAVESLRQAIKFEPDTAELHHRLGVALRWNRQFDEAIVEQRRALELDPHIGFAREQSVKAMIQKGQVEEARMEWRMNSGVIPDSATEHNSFGVLLAEVGKLAEATREFEAAYRIEPENIDAKNNLARVYEARAKAANGTEAASQPSASSP